ncbi:MAG TPA: DsbA family protein [Nitrospira sp.]|nr:DsbA family protein [Nitrospira sp.]
MNSGKLFELYSDFNCPFCYALHERLHEMNLLDRCAWRGVQHAPYLPRPMTQWQGSLAAELRREVAVVQRLTSGLPISLPSGKPNTRAAIEQASRLLSRNQEAGMEFVRRAYRAFWCDGLDLSDSMVLESLVKKAGGEWGGDHAGDKSSRAIQKWEETWHAAGQAGVPLVVSPTGELIVGCAPAAQIRRFFDKSS